MLTCFCIIIDSIMEEVRNSMPFPFSKAFLFLEKPHRGFKRSIFKPCEAVDPEACGFEMHILIKICLLALDTQ